MPQSSGLLCRRLFFAKEDAEVVANLKKAGVIPLCVTNTSELCMWYESSNLVYGRTNNAYHHGRIVGGSSGTSTKCISVARRLGTAKMGRSAWSPRLQRLRSSTCPYDFVNLIT